MSEHDTFESFDDVTTMMKDPRYATSPRYREEVAQKLAASRAAGSLPDTGSKFHDHSFGRSHTTITASAIQPEGSSGMNVGNGADPVWAQARRVSMGGQFFENAEQVAQAMSSPQMAEPGFRDAVVEMVQRSQREGFIGQDLQALPKEGRFARTGR